MDADATFFITINARPKGVNHLCNPAVGQELLASAAHRQRIQQWYLHVFLLMPDHVHLLASFSEEPGMQGVVTAWKRYTARRFGINWQRDFFDHRIRSHESAEQKAEYVLMNPVRAGLVERPKDWPYVLTSAW